LALVGALMCLGACSHVPAAGLTSASLATTIADTGQTTTPPPGFIGLCMQHSEVCASTPEGTAAKLALNDQNRDTLVSVNDKFNREIAYKTDMQNFGMKNVWNLNAIGGSGDCKDYALAKQQALIAAGLPREALRLAIVKTPKNELHAVLTVNTDKGDFVLDSINPVIMPWSNTGYSWLSRQSANNPLQWLQVAQNF
jgi:predicted transglutaminase-like cysteine proteinase